MVSHPTQLKSFISGFRRVSPGHFMTAIFKHLLKSQWKLLSGLDCQEFYFAKKSIRKPQFWGFPCAGMHVHILQIRFLMF